MNREIKFRGLRTDGKGWVYGYYSPVIVPILGTLGHCINEGGYKAIDIIPESVGQFTGLKDINGVEIYEGDKMSCDGKIKVVVYNKIQCFFELVFETGVGFKDYIEYFTDRGGVVIGNIHEPKTT